MLDAMAMPANRAASCSVRVALLRGPRLAATAGPPHVELVASAEPNEMTTNDVLQARQIVRISMDGQLESVRRARQLDASVGKRDPAALVAVGPLATVTATEMRDELLPVARRSIRAELDAVGGGVLLDLGDALGVAAAPFLVLAWRRGLV